MPATDSHGEPYVLTELSESGLTGSISIAPDVLIEIIELTVQEFGSSALIGSKRRNRGKALELSGSDGKSESGHWHSRNGIKVRLEAATVDAEIDISVQRVANVPQLASDLKIRIGQTIDRMLGMKIGAIGIHVVEIAPDEGTTTR